MTGASREEQVARDIEKFYANPGIAYSGGPLPLDSLVFLEEGPGVEIEPIRGAQRLMRLQDDHYTAMHFAAARQFDPAAHFAHLSRLARQIDMARFARPRDLALFGDGVDAVHRYVVGRTEQTMEHG